MTEDEIRETLDSIDALRKRAKTLDDIARWPGGLPSEVVADKNRGFFRSIWRSDRNVTMGEVTLTLEERAELRDWMFDKARRLRAQADSLSKTLTTKED